MEISTTRMLQFSQQLKKFYAKQFIPLIQKSRLSMRELDVLLFLANNPDYDTARDIAEFRSLAKSQVSQAVELLAAEDNGGFLGADRHRCEHAAQRQAEDYTQNLFHSV